MHRLDLDVVYDLDKQFTMLGFVPNRFVPYVHYSARFGFVHSLIPPVDWIIGWQSIFRGWRDGRSSWRGCLVACCGRSGAAAPH